MSIFWNLWNANKGNTYKDILIFLFTYSFSGKLYDKCISLMVLHSKLAKAPKTICAASLTSLKSCSSCIISNFRSCSMAGTWLCCCTFCCKALYKVFNWSILLLSMLSVCKGRQSKAYKNMFYFNPCIMLWLISAKKTWIRLESSKSI